MLFRSVAAPSQFLAELPEEAMNYVDLSDGPMGGSFAMPSRPAFRPSPSIGGFRLTTAAALGGSSPNGPPDNLSAFRPGVSVMHPEFGLGRIISIDGEGSGRKGRVAFTVGGERTFVLAKSPLRPLTGG